MDDISPTILVMTKEPRPGHVKTRLRPLLNDDQCAELSACFLIDTIAKARRSAPTVIVAYTAIGIEGRIFDLVPESVACIKQIGNDLGQRLSEAVKFVCSNGGGPIIVIGTDSPTVPLDIFHSSFKHLRDRETDLVLGGTEDGGYYLIGLKTAYDEVFRDIPWSTGEVYDRTLQQAKKIGMAGIIEMPQWYDVDDPEDLIRLYNEAANDVAINEIAPETCRWLLENQALFDHSPSPS